MFQDQYSRHRQQQAYMGGNRQSDKLGESTKIRGIDGINTGETGNASSDRHYSNST